MDSLDSGFSETTPQKVKRGARGRPFSHFRAEFFIFTDAALGASLPDDGGA